MAADGGATVLKKKLNTGEVMPLLSIRGLVPLPEVGLKKIPGVSVVDNPNLAWALLLVEGKGPT